MTTAVGPMSGSMEGAGRAPGLQPGRRADGALLLGRSRALDWQGIDVADRLREHASLTPDRILISAPEADGRRSLTYAQALADARALHGRLARAGLKRGARVATLLPAGIDAMVLRLACLLGNFTHASLPPHPWRETDVCPPEAGEALRAWRIVRPDLLIVPDGHGLAGRGPACSLDMLPPADPRADTEAAPDDWTAIFFTSGSSGAPKGVPVTRGMIASCQSAYRSAWPFLADSPPVLIDWMPWTHVFGGLDNLFKIIWNGGSLHLAPPPSAKGMDAMLDLMELVRPTLSIGVPLGLKLLMDAWEADPARVARGCGALNHIFFAGAAMEPELWARLQAFRADMGVRLGRSVTVLSGYGATEAASTMCLAPANLDRPGVLGWPLPGHEIALVDCDGLQEIRFRGPNLAPCYLTEDGEAPLPMDEYGFYRTGDAGVFDDSTDHLALLRFDGRIAEDFKLSSGIKVRAGLLRSQLLLKLGPEAHDLVIGGAGFDRLVAVILAAPEAGPQISDLFSARLADWNRDNPASSVAIARFDLADFIPRLEAGEVSAKGQLVPSRILRNHAAIFGDIAAGRRGRIPG